MSSRLNGCARSAAMSRAVVRRRIDENAASVFQDPPWRINVVLKAARVTHLSVFDYSERADVGKIKRGPFGCCEHSRIHDE